jgi:ribosome-binding factor A
MIPNRKKRIAQLMLRNISEVMRFEMKDPNIGFVSLTDVEVASDLATAKIFVSVLMDDIKAREAQVERLNHAAGFIRASIKGKMSIKRVPTLRFILDTSIERGVRVSSLIDRVRAEDGAITKEGNESEVEEDTENGSESET